MNAKFIITTAFWLPFVFIGLPAAGLYLDGVFSLSKINFVFNFTGIVLSFFAVVVFVWCWHLFSKLGGGTPNPAKPPHLLVVEGPFRRTRNPIYIAYVSYLLGCAVFFGSPSLFIISVLFFLAMNYLVVSVEEPLLEKKFGNAYKKYVKKVPRWI